MGGRTRPPAPRLQLIRGQGHNSAMRTALALIAALFLGARGRLGLAAARAFAQVGWQVLAQVRPGARGPALPAIAGVWWMPVAVEDTAALAAQAQGAQVVVHALNPAYTHKAWREEAPALMEAAIAITRQLRATLMLHYPVVAGRSMAEKAVSSADHGPGNDVYYKGALMLHTLRGLIGTGGS